MRPSIDLTRFFVGEHACHARAHGARHSRPTHGSGIGVSSDPIPRRERERDDTERLGVVDPTDTLSS